MPAGLLIALLLQPPSGCTADVVSGLADAGRRVRAFDRTGAIRRLQNTPADCETTRLAFLYLSGLQAAGDAYRSGGDEASLAPVNAAIEELGRRAATNPRADLLRITLMAAAAAAQSERDDMTLLLDQARSLEKKLVATGLPGAPGETAHEAAGDLWLQVHRFESARAAYREAIELFGPSPRSALGLARAAVQLHDDPGACAAYRALIAQWASADTPLEIAEARQFVASDRCATRPAAGPR
jgi:tetratricopeptide (TPR) repeat protein